MSSVTSETEWYWAKEVPEGWGSSLHRHALVHVPLPVNFEPIEGLVPVNRNYYFGARPAPEDRQDEAETMLKVATVDLLEALGRTSRRGLTFKYLSYLYESNKGYADNKKFMGEHVYFPLRFMEKVPGDEIPHPSIQFAVELGSANGAALLRRPEIDEVPTI